MVLPIRKSLLAVKLMQWNPLAEFLPNFRRLPTQAPRAYAAARVPVWLGRRDASDRFHREIPVSRHIQGNSGLQHRFRHRGTDSGIRQTWRRGSSLADGRATTLIKRALRPPLVNKFPNRDKNGAPKVQEENSTSNHFQKNVRPDKFNLANSVNDQSPPIASTAAQCPRLTRYPASAT
jgi:hypothetical protein